MKQKIEENDQNLDTNYEQTINGFQSLCTDYSIWHLNFHKEQI